ncbi:hypothetical protein [Anabaena sp. UHCC 0399]|uniref:hypothetical protein n=1 Tax=Anabaena sp. UHCC 0399 TaxID=3110238 RepID=UPI002B21FA87|nr:hypothetical protein [Anabaena sp. UHCC 0399]MEA5565899.1 hypothetical protein [Anabaena sp. UHCC 0399]
MMSDDKPPLGVYDKTVVQFFGICTFENNQQASILVNWELGMGNWKLGIGHGIFLPPASLVTIP